MHVNAAVNETQYVRHQTRTHRLILSWQSTNNDITGLHCRVWTWNRVSWPRVTKSAIWTGPGHSHPGRVGSWVSETDPVPTLLHCVSI